MKNTSNKSKYNNTSKQSTLDSYGVAPYNFVSLPERSIAEYETLEELPKHNELSDNLLNGTIEFDITAKMPLIIGSDCEDKNNKKMFKNPKGDITIPGNTIRGFLRNNAAILSMSNITEDIENERFYFRSFGKTNLSKEYTERMQIKSKRNPKTNSTYSIPETVKAGYIYKVADNDYVIVPAKKIENKQYYRIGEESLRQINKNVQLNYMYNNRITELIEKKYMYKNDRDKKFFLRGIKNFKYETNEPQKISFKLGGNSIIKGIDKPDVLTYNGWIVSSKYIDGKRAHYIINEPDFNSNEKIEFNNDNNKIDYINFYESDLIRTKKVKDIKEEENFYTLPKKTGKENGKPIFYGEFNNKIYLGFTQYFRIPYDKSIIDGICDEYKNNEGISYCESIFGFSNREIHGDNKVSYKSRISVEDAIFFEKVKMRTGVQQRKYYEAILAEPKASCYPNYLEQNNKGYPKKMDTYNSEKFRIRGIKQYWQKDYLDEEAISKNSNIKSKLYPIESGSKFKGKIHFKNLTEEELGLILWALKVDDKATENIGMGKPLGFGRIEIEDINVLVENLEEKYSSMTMDFTRKEERGRYINKYIESFSKKYKVNLLNQQGVKELIKLKTNVVKKSNKDEVRYMDLKEFKECKPLLTVEEQVSKFK